MTPEQWNAIETNDASYDGVFYYGLKTTRIVCRPSCPAKACNPKNVIIFDDCESAVKAGFRPCQRCRPDIPGWRGPKPELTDAAKHWIAGHYTGKFSLKEIAAGLAVNGNYLLHVFRQHTGMTLLEYHNFLRCEEARRLLADRDTPVARIAAETGFSSASHFTRVFKAFTGKTPSEYRSSLDSSDDQGSRKADKQAACKPGEP